MAPSKGIDGKGGTKRRSEDRSEGQPQKLEVCRLPRGQGRPGRRLEGWSRPGPTAGEAQTEAGLCRSRVPSQPPAAGRTPESLCRRYAYKTPPRRARVIRGTQLHFAVATPTKPRRAERVRPAAPRFTLRLLHLRYSAALSAFAPRHPASLTLSELHLQYSAALRAFAPRHPASLCGFYAHDSPPRQDTPLRPGRI